MQRKEGKRKNWRRTEIQEGGTEGWSGRVIGKRKEVNKAGIGVKERRG